MIENLIFTICCFISKACGLLCMLDEKQGFRKDDGKLALLQ